MYQTEPVSPLTSAVPGLIEQTVDKLRGSNSDLKGICIDLTAHLNTLIPDRNGVDARKEAIPTPAQPAPPTKQELLEHELDELVRLVDTLRDIAQRVHEL